jgi:hypothetical protein
LITKGGSRPSMWAQALRTRRATIVRYMRATLQEWVPLGNSLW